MKTTAEQRRLPVQLHLAPDIIEVVDRLAQAEDISRGAWIRRLVLSATRGLRDEVVA